MADNPKNLVRIRDEDIIRPGDTVEHLWTGEEIKVKAGKDGKFAIKTRAYKSFFTQEYEPEEIHKLYRKVSGSPAFRFIKLATQKIKEKSSHKRPRLIDTAVKLAIEGQMRFDPDDFQQLYDELRILTGGEYLYSLTVASGNTSAIKAFEKYTGRTPFFWSDHNGKPQRLVQGSFFQWEGYQVKVTSFKDRETPPILIACHQENVTDEAGQIVGTNTRKVFRISHADIERREELVARIGEVRLQLYELLKERGLERGTFPCLKLRSIHEEGAEREFEENLPFMCETCAEKAWGEKYKDFRYHYHVPDIVLRCASCQVPLWTEPTVEDVRKELDILVRSGDQENDRDLLVFRLTLNLPVTFETGANILKAAGRLGLG